MLVIPHIFGGSSHPWWRRAIHVAWLSEGKLILVLEPSCISFIHISVYLTWLSPKGITGLLAAILRHVFTFCLCFLTKIVFGFKQSPGVRWEGRREENIKNYHESDFTQFPSHQVSLPHIQGCWQEIWGFGSETKSLAFTVDAVSRVSSFSCSASLVYTVMNEPSHAYIRNRLCWKKESPHIKGLNILWGTENNLACHLPEQVNLPTAAAEGISYS